VVWYNVLIDNGVLRGKSEHEKQEILAEYADYLRDCRKDEQLEKKAEKEAGNNQGT